MVYGLVAIFSTFPKKQTLNKKINKTLFVLFQAEAL